MKKSHLEETVLRRILTAGFPKPELEYKFHPDRKWRFDFAWPDINFAVEIEGGLWVEGRHNRPIGYSMDTGKYNAAVLLGWRVLRYTSLTIDNVIPDLKLFFKKA